MKQRQLGPEPPLAQLLLMASRWFDIRSREELERRGWPRLSAAQSLLFAHLEEGGVAPAELARRLGQSRQATHDLIRGLVRVDLLQVLPDPDRRNGRLVCVTTRGRELAIDAYEILGGLERSLGGDTAKQLRALLTDLELESR